MTADVPDDVLAALLERKYGDLQVEAWDPQAQAWLPVGSPVPIRALTTRVRPDVRPGTTVRLMQRTPGAEPIPIVMPALYVHGCVYVLEVGAVTVAPLGAEPTWETCAGPCGREYAYPHLCREHHLCGICHPPQEPAP